MAYVRSRRDSKDSTWLVKPKPLEKKHMELNIMPEEDVKIENDKLKVALKRKFKVDPSSNIESVNNFRFNVSKTTIHLVI